MGSQDKNLPYLQGHEMSCKQGGDDLDPRVIKAGFDLAGYHIKSGHRSFVDYAQIMIEEYGHGARPHLLPILSFLFATRSAVRKNGQFTLTQRGKYYIVVLMREFFIGVNNFRQAAIAMDN